MTNGFVLISAALPRDSLSAPMIKPAAKQKEYRSEDQIKVRSANFQTP
jgi:hypothetical protein